MGKMDNMSQSMQRVFDAKAERRRKLAGLSYPEKVRIVVELQKMSYPILRKKTMRACVWTIK